MQAGIYGEERLVEVALVDVSILKAAAVKHELEQEKARVRAQEDDARRAAVQRAEEEAEIWKKRAEEERAKAEAARACPDELLSQGNGKEGAAPNVDTPEILDAQNAVTEEVRQAQRALRLLEVAKAEANLALEAMARAYNAEEEARQAQERAHAETLRAEQLFKIKRIEDDSKAADARERAREERESLRVQHELQQTLRKQEEEKRHFKARERLRKETMVQENIDWPENRAKASAHNEERQEHWQTIEHIAAPLLQSAMRRVLAHTHLDKQRKATTVLLRCLQAKWEQIDGDSRLREGRRQIDRERRAREEAQRKRLAEAGEAKRSAEAALNRRLEDEAHARGALETALKRRQEEDALSKAQQQAETARRAAEDEENKRIEAERSRIKSQKDEMERERKEREQREQRRRERTAEKEAFAGVKVWGGWRRELGGPPRLIPSRPTKPRPEGPPSNRPGAMTPQKTLPANRSNKGGEG